MTALKALFGTLSLLLLLVVAAAALLTPDILTALTVYPVWIWLPLGLGLTLMAWRREWRGRLLLLTLLWMGTTLALSEEPAALLRGFRPEPPLAPGETRIRVISLNCYGGLAEAAEEVIPHKPDIVLLQEAPGASYLPGLARQIFGEAGRAIGDRQAGILARGPITRTDLPHDLRIRMVMGEVRLPDAPMIQVANVHLLASPAYFDLWNRTVWTAMRDNRRARRAQAEQVADLLKLFPESRPTLMGGDFNAAQRDPITQAFRPRFRDAFFTGGVGWGPTYMSGIPVVRIDRFFTDARFRVLRLRAVKTRHSDHRMLIADLAVK